MKTKGVLGRAVKCRFCFEIWTSIENPDWDLFIKIPCNFLFDWMVLVISHWKVECVWMNFLFLFFYCIQTEIKKKFYNRPHAAFHCVPGIHSYNEMDPMDIYVYSRDQLKFFVIRLLFIQRLISSNFTNSMKQFQFILKDDNKILLQIVSILSSIQHIEQWTVIIEKGRETHTIYISWW